jgi:LacI family transcriptional regulator
MLLVATIQDVARLAGVSPTTAKRALREPDRLSPGTLKRVQAAVRSLDYEPDQRAGSLRGGQSRTIGLIVASIVEPFFAQFARTVGQTLAGAGYTLLISENEYSAAHELPELQRLYGQRVAGVILRPGYGPESRDYLRRLTHKGLHLLEYDYTPPGSPYPHVMLGNAAAMEDAVRYLHGLGHERVAALGTYHPQIHPEVRSEAFPRIMAGLGLTVPADYQRVTQLTEETAYSLTHELMALAAPPHGHHRPDRHPGHRGLPRHPRAGLADSGRHQPRHLRQLSLDGPGDAACHGGPATRSGDGGHGRPHDAGTY